MENQIDGGPAKNQRSLPPASHQFVRQPVEPRHRINFENLSGMRT